MQDLPIVGQAPPLAEPGPKGFNLWGYGFRPFFLFGALSAALLMALWLSQLTSGRPLSRLPGPLWHAHEMYFGFTVAIVAGFLLTAVPNWTGLPTPRGRALAGLLLLWAGGRGASWYGGSAAWIDLAFLPVLALALARPLIQAGKLNNLVFLPVLGWLTLSNAVFWWGLSSANLELSRGALNATLYAILTLVSIIGGRVIPFFSSRPIEGYRVRRLQAVEWLANLAPALAALAELTPAIPQTGRAGVLLGLAVIQGLRWLLWFHPGVLAVPLLWVLYLGYAFLPLGLGLKAVAWLGWGSQTAATHALTAGCMGVMCLGMMARVALGHSGRPLEPSRWMIVAFALLGLAAGLRSLVPFFWPHWSAPSWWWAGAFWISAYALYALVYAPILCSPRADGKPG